MTDPVPILEQVESLRLANKSAEAFSLAEEHWAPDADIELVRLWGELLLEEQRWIPPGWDALPETATDEDPMAVALAGRAVQAARRLDLHGSSHAAEQLARYATDVLGAQPDVRAAAVEALRLALRIVLDQDSNRWPELIEGYQALIALEETCYGAESSATLRSRLHLVTSLMASGNQGRADQELKRINEIARQQKAPPPETAYYLFIVSQSALIQRRARHAVEFEKEALALIERTRTLTEPDVMALIGVAELHFSFHKRAQKGDLERARGCYRRVADLEDVEDPAVVVQQVFAMRRLAELAIDEQEPEVARDLLTRAVARVEGTFGPLHLEVAYANADLGRFLVILKETGEAISHLERAIAALDTRSGKGSEVLDECRTQLRFARSILEEEDEASAAWRALRQELEGIVDEAGGRDAAAGGSAEHDQGAGRYLAACTAVLEHELGLALDHLLEVLKEGGKEERQRAELLSKRILQLCGTSDPEVNERRRALMPWL